MKRVLLFNVSWCEACKLLIKNLESIKFDVPVEIVDVEKNPEVVDDYGITKFPILIKLDGNIEMSRFIGVRPVKDLEDWLND